MKAAISWQCDGLISENMEIGYFIHSKKLWINSRLDVNDVWSIAERGEKVTFWCLDTTARNSTKRKREQAGEES